MTSANDSGPPAITVAAAQAQFDAEVTYLNTATLGLPPRCGWEALQAALTEWRAGTANPLAYDAMLATARDSYARLTRVDPATVAVGSQVSVLAGLVAASIPDGSEVLTATGDFSSILFPFYAQARRGVTVREVPLGEVVDAITPETDLVSVSAVQSSDGRVLDLDALQHACALTGTKVLLDTTQAIGWLPVDASQFAYTVCGGYKWLLTPRGTAYLTIQPELMDSLVPHYAGWYAGADPWSSIYGSPLRLAADARRFDVSPAWHAWIAAGPAVSMLADLGAEALHEHALSLANRFRSGLGLAAGDSAIVSLAVGAGAPQAMASARVVGAVRAGRLRLAFHISTSERDVDRALDVLCPYVLSDAGSTRTV